jgi:hypothetical protein
VRWECPLGRRDGRKCLLFDGPCEPMSNGCLLANTPYSEPDTADDRDTPLLTIQPVPWPQVERTRRHRNVARRTAREGRAAAVRGPS